MEEKSGITLSELFWSLINYWYVILFTIILGTLTTAVIAFVFITPKYKSTAEILTHSYVQTDKIDYSDTQRLIETIAYHFETDRVLEDVIEKLGPNVISLSTLKSGLTINHTKTNFYVKISFTHTDPILAKIITQQIVDSGEMIANAPDGVPLENTFTIVNFAKEGVYVSPNKTLYLIVGFLLGGVIGAAIVFILEFASNTFKNKEEVEVELELQVMGVIPEYTLIDKDIEEMEIKEKNNEKII